MTSIPMSCQATKLDRWRKCNCFMEWHLPRAAEMGRDEGEQLKWKAQLGYIYIYNHIEDL